MILTVSLALALQVTVRVGGSDAKSDSVRKARIDSITIDARERQRDRERRTPRRQPVTPELEASAFLDAGARTILLRARDARMRQDSTLTAYDATTYQRVSVGLGFRAIGRDRLLFRTENSTHVRWSRNNGAWIDITGKRQVFPAMKGMAEDNDADMQDITPLPYYPGREALWMGAGLARAEVDERELVHPIAIGSEAYYRFSSGDSLVITLPDGKRITLRELRVEPRRPEWRLSVGSFWFDDSSGQLVRAVYRLAVPLNIWSIVDEETKRDAEEAIKAGRKPGGDDGPPGWVKGLMNPMEANLEAVTIEYGLFGTRFWLPRTQYAEGSARAGFMRVPFKIEERFKYASVNGPDPVPAIPARVKSIRDSLFAGDSTRWADLTAEQRRERIRRMTDAALERSRQQKAAREAECAATGYHTTAEDRYNGALQLAVRMPCDTTKLAVSPDLPKSIFDEGDELFDTGARDELLKALDFGLQAAWAPRAPVWRYGPGMSRYNRVEGFSTGLGVSEELGKGYTVDGLARIGTGDWAPGIELGGERSNGRTILRLNGFRRLNAASEWGAPLTSNAGLGALLFGRDDGFYYRSAGLELERQAVSGTGMSMRLFAERETPASVTTTFNLAKSLGSATTFGPNIDAMRGNVAGLVIRDTHTLGLNPQSWRAFSDLRLEGAWFDPIRDVDGEAKFYSRAALDLSLSRGFGERFGAALSVGAGISDNAPVQRHFILGGTSTVRGQRPGVAIGESYWLGRLELGAGLAGARPVVFGDLGWAGPRNQWSHPGRPLSGVGAGVSFLDGLIRIDLARGLYPKKRFRFDLYFEGSL